MIKFKKDRPVTKALSDVCRADKVGPAGKRFPFDLKTALAARTASSTSTSKSLKVFWPTTVDVKNTNRSETIFNDIIVMR